MALSVYTDTTPSAKLSSDASLSNPLLVKLDGKGGGSLEQLLYVRNDDATRWYRSLKLQPIDTSGVSIIDGTGGFYWKLSEGNTQPTEEEWDSIVGGESILLDNIGSAGVGDIATYLPFWLKINIPRNTKAQTHTDVVLRITADQLNV